MKLNSFNRFDKLDVEMTPIVPTPRAKRTTSATKNSRYNKKAPASPSDVPGVKPYYSKGEILAVRNEEGLTIF